MRNPVIIAVNINMIVIFENYECVIDSYFRLLQNRNQETTPTRPTNPNLMKIPLLLVTTQKGDIGITMSTHETN